MELGLGFGLWSEDGRVRSGTVGRGSRVTGGGGVRHWGEII
jgi:hypothetical protein